MARLLMIISSARNIDLASQKAHPTGYWADEVLKPYDRFVAAGVEVVVATPDGQPPQPDPFGLEPRFHYPDQEHLEAFAGQVQEESAARAQAMAERLAAIGVLQRPRHLKEMTNEEVLSFDGVFFPGGHGPMVDLAANADVGRVLHLMQQQEKMVAALCHGPAALLSAGEGPEGYWLFDGYKLASFTNEEEDQTPYGKLGMTWYLESALKNRGAVFDDADAEWVSHVVVDRNLVTGQNPESSEATAEAILKKLKVKVT